MDANENRYTYKDMNFYRIGGPLFVVASPIFFLFDKKLPMFAFAGWAFVIFGVLATLFSSTLTATTDKSTRTLQLRHNYLLFRRTKNIPFDDIADIQAQQSRGETSQGTSANVYRIVVVLKDGTVIPFRSYFDRNASKKKTALDLRQFVTGSRRSDVVKVEPPASTLSMS
jgi:hypothetical protein